MAKPATAARPTPPETTLAVNRRATHDYHVLERHECGVVLTGSEVKSIKDGKISLTEAYAQFERDELWLLGAHISEYVLAHRRNHEPMRKRKLLMKRRELDKLAVSVAKDGLTLIPLKVYSRGRNIKVEIGLCKGKQVHDKRASLKEREAKREMDRAMRDHRR
ncbi:MAG TPA: SsrA-binding protein SmpB [Nannocystaceae bacterium]|nr:SsrA-binding protein SmpB [Nannocystaceae bacterium]